MEERIIAQENENQKKSGWFSQSWQILFCISTTFNFNICQYEKSTLTNEQFTREGTPTVPPVDKEDELLPRMYSAHALPRVVPIPLPGSGNTPTPSQPLMPSNDPSSHIHLHMGFDLNAIKNALQEVKQKALQAPSLTSPLISLTQLSLPLTVPPSNCSQLTLPVQVVGTNTPCPSLLDYGYGASQSPSEDKLPAGMGLGYDHPSHDSVSFAGPSHSGRSIVHCIVMVIPSGQHCRPRCVESCVHNSDEVLPPRPHCSSHQAQLQSNTKQCQCEFSLPLSSVNSLCLPCPFNSEKIHNAQSCLFIPLISL